MEKQYNEITNKEAIALNKLERRVRTCRLLEKMERNREYSEALKLKNKSIYKPTNQKSNHQSLKAQYEE